MAQRLTQSRQLYFGVETTQGVEVVGTSANAIAYTNLIMQPSLAFDRRRVAQQMGYYPGNVASQPNPGLRFTVQLRGGAMNSTVVPLIDPLLKVLFSAGQHDTGSTAVQAGSTTTVINVASAANFSVGNAVAIETTASSGLYEVGWIAATNTVGQNTITLTDALTFTPVATAAVNPSMTYKPANSGQGSLSFQVWLDSTSRVSFAGCQGTCQLDCAAPNAIPTMTMDWDAISWTDFDGLTEPSPTYDTATPPTNYKFKLGAFPISTKLSNWDLGQTIGNKRSQNAPLGTFLQVVADRMVNGYFQGYDQYISTTITVGSNGQSLPQSTINVTSTTGFPPSGSMVVVTGSGAQTVAYTGVTGTTFTGCSGGTGTMSTGGFVGEPELQFFNWTAATAQAIAQQFGNTQYNMVAYQIPSAQRTYVDYGDDSNNTTDQISFQGNITSGADDIRLAFL